MNNISTFDICDGVSFSHIKSDKFKDAQISFTFFHPLDVNLVSGYSLLASVLSDSCSKFKNFRDLNQFLEETYGACIDYDIFKVGSYHAIGLSVCALDDKFTIEQGDNIDKMVDLLCELVFNPLVNNNCFDEKVVKKRKKEIIDLINSEFVDKRTWSMIRCKQELFKNEKCGISKYGTISDLEKLDENSLFRIYKHCLEKSRVKIVMVSSSDYHKVIGKVKSKFESINRSVDFDFESIDEKIPESVNEVSEKMNVQQCKLVMAFRTPFIAPCDTHAMSLFSAIYGGIPTSKLFMNVREKLNLCYYCSSRFDSSTGILYIESGIEQDNLGKTIDEIINQLNLLKKGELSERDVEEAKEFMVQGSKSVSDSLGQVCDWYTLRFPIRVDETPEEFASSVSKLTRDDILNCSSKIYLDTVYTIVRGE